MTTMQRVFRVVAFLLYFMAGAWDIMNVIINYKAERYLRVGIDVMFAFCMMLMIVMLYIR
jgi:hypothetical protein